MDKPRIITLCGSTRFTEEMLVKQWELTKQGYIVLSWCALPIWYTSGWKDKDHIGDQEGVKEIVNENHKRKIDISDEILVINVGGYIGEDTNSEIVKMYSQGIPMWKIGQRFGITTREVRRELKKAGVNLRLHERKKDGEKYLAGGRWNVHVRGETKRHARVVMEKILGRPIPKGFEVHHKNRKGLDDSLGNLQLLTEREHSRLHKQQRRALWDAK